jgi:hypothetical protein
MFAWMYNYSVFISLMHLFAVKYFDPNSIDDSNTINDIH